MSSDNLKLQELESLRSRIEEIEAELRASRSEEDWPPRNFYAAYYATTGFMLGIFGAAASLLANVIGAPLAGKSPLELIRVYLTFPLGEEALHLKDSGGLVLTIGCCLYLLTGMLLGVPFYCALVWMTDKKPLFVRMFVASILAALLWTLNFHGILSWLQPLLFGGHWITDPSILPSWVGLMTHLIFGWTLALLYPWGRFQPYKRPDVAAE